MIEDETEGDSVADAALLRAHVNGDPDAFAVLVARQLYRRVTGNELAASRGGQCLPGPAAQHEAAGNQPLPENLDRSRKMGLITKDPVKIKEQRSVVVAALGALNADQRAALVLVDMEGYSVEEAVQIFGCAQGTVKSRCARGRSRLLPLLSHLKQAEADS